MTPRAHLEELLTCAQKNWMLAMDGSDDTRREAILHALNYFSTAWYLRALLAASPDAAQEACDHLLDILGDGGAAGEWTWKLLAELGIDPGTIKPAVIRATGVVR